MKAAQNLEARNRDMQRKSDISRFGFSEPEPAAPVEAVQFNKVQRSEYEMHRNRGIQSSIFGDPALHSARQPPSDKRSLPESPLSARSQMQSHDLFGGKSSQDQQDAPERFKMSKLHRVFSFVLCV